MAEIYTKNKDGELEKIGNANSDQLSRVSNDTNIDAIKSELKKYWANGKAGKHYDLMSKHGHILLDNLTVLPDDFFKQINKNHFTFTEFQLFPLRNFLKKAHIDQFVKPGYLDACMKVTTPRPAIGRGEFLWVATFKNIRFAEGSGDLVDDEGRRIEVKGNHANLGGEGPFKQMNQSLLFSIFKQFGTNTHDESLNLETISTIQKLIKQNPQKAVTVMGLLQNAQKASATLAEQMVELFNSTQDLTSVIAAAHLLTYLKIQKADFLLGLNEHVYSCFKAPRDLAAAHKIIKHFNVSGWVSGNRGISITLKNS